MRKSVLVTLLVLLVTIAAPLPASASFEAFEGTWEAYDPAPPAGDGSYMTLTVTPRGVAAQVRWYDEYATAACDPPAPVVLKGIAKERGGVLHVFIRSVRCQGSTATFDSFFFLLTAQPDGTLIDNGGIVWTRV